MKTINSIFLSGPEHYRAFKNLLILLAITWLPLFLFSLFSGTLIYGKSGIRIPFIYDNITNVRLLISLPVIFYSIKIIYPMISRTYDNFLSSSIIKDEDQESFKKITESVYALFNSKIINIVILLVSYLFVIFFWEKYEDIAGVNTWRSINPETTAFPAARYWYFLISVPLFQFFAFKMGWLYILYTVSLIRISLKNLNLSSASPDGCGGLAFLGYTQVFFMLIGFSQNAIISASIANNVMYNNESVSNFRLNIVTGIVSSFIIYLFPLFFFSKQLLKTKLVSIFEYSKLGLNYSTMFENKWINKNAPKNDEPLLGTADIQSLADLNNTIKNIQDQQIFPLSFNTFIKFLVVLILPYLPLLLLKFTKEELIKGVIDFIF